MGAKQMKPMLDVHTVQQRLPRSELLYLKNLFLFLIQHSPSSTAAANTAASLALPANSPALNQSLSSSALANPSNMDLMALRLPKSAVTAYLLAPSFPGSSQGLLDKFFQIFDYNGYGTALDYSEYLVMMWTLWYGQAHEELSRFLFTLFDVGGNGRIGKKEYRKVAQALLEEYGSKNDASVPITNSNAKEKEKEKSGGLTGDQREYLGPLFDFYFHLALYQHDRDHDKLLSPPEFANFAEEDLLVTALVHGRKDPRQAKQRVRELLGAKGESLLPPAAPAPPQLKKLGGSTSNASASPTPAIPPSAALTRNFLGDEEVEDTTGTIWRQQKRSTIKNQVRRASIAPTTPTPR